MENEKRLIDANALCEKIGNMKYAITNNRGGYRYCNEEEKNEWEKLDSFYRLVCDATTVDAVGVADMREFAEDVVYQFGYYGQYNGRLHILHGGLSTLEWAFDILGWDNPHPVPEFECEVDGCHEHATCGKSTADGYKRVCGKHFAHYEKMDGDGNG